MNLVNDPAQTTPEEKQTMIQTIVNKHVTKHRNDIVAIGVYGSVANGNAGPYSDIEMHIVTKDGVLLESHEFIYPPYKIEIGSIERSKIIEKAKRYECTWPIWAGSFINVLRVYDPEGFFETLKIYPYSHNEEEKRGVMREFMIWEPYECMGKIRNAYAKGHLTYIPQGAHQLLRKASLLVGLQNNSFYSTQSKMFEEAMQLPSKPPGFNELALLVLSGELTDSEVVYKHCEDLWQGLNTWFDELGIQYKVTSLPF
ncbi:KNTase domain-containing protein [Pontibacillus chungwhensis BH030062]|uniref:KNTase domain-containing protein n=1 Tax=Pontibacillus chungwhensis BH030062 TaxID=1385513 RepID=A0A0A2UUY7_9BACI|nr:kanamycin nucleotidyltransferase C-terminal domain-containing protein [Pontibacillus chungwhensis]KGP90578.1 KNTase domain-containing protein [Pontibacillus chungwhensis BH030062]